MPAENFRLGHFLLILLPLASLRKSSYGGQDKYPRQSAANCFSAGLVNPATEHRAGE